MINIIKQLNLLVSFLLEMILLFIAGYWGFQQGKSGLMSIIFAITIPVAIIVLWGFFAAPKSGARLKNPLRTIFKLILFVLGTVICFITGHIFSGIVFGSIVILNVVVARILLQDY
jgi:amino acid transporter